MPISDKSLVGGHGEPLPYPRNRRKPCSKTWMGYGPKTTMAGKSCSAMWMGCGVQNNKGWKPLFCNADGVRVPKQPKLESPVLQCGWGMGSKTAKAGKHCFTTWIRHVFHNSKCWKALFYNMDGVRVLKQPRLESLVSRHGWGTGPETTMAGKLCFATWMWYGFQKGKGWRISFYNVDGVRVPKQPRLENSVLQCGWGTGPKTAKAGKLCFTTWMGCRTAKAGKPCFATWMRYGFQNSKGWKALFYNVDGVRVPKHPSSTGLSGGRASKEVVHPSSPSYNS